MTKAEPCMTLASVVVEGLAPGMMPRAEEDIRSLFAPLERVPLDLVFDIELSVLVTGEMAAQVDRIRREHGTFTRPYRREKESGIAAGITLTAPDGPPFRVTLVLDNGLWARSDAMAVVERVYMLGYTFGHALLRGRETSTDSPSATGDPNIHAEELRDLAADLIDAFDADCTALALCQSLHLDDGSPVQCSKWLGDDVIASVAELAETLCVFAAIDIQFYRVTGVGLEELYPRASLLLGQTLQMLVHTLALYVADGRLDTAMEALRQNPGFRTYLLPDADEITAALNDVERDVCEVRLALAVQRILERLGLRLEDMPDGGLYVHVSEPALCNIAEISSS